jgi:hypothetical protein
MLMFNPNFTGFLFYKPSLIFFHKGIIGMFNVIGATDKSFLNLAIESHMKKDKADQ